MLSGLGPAGALQDLNITVNIDLPGVGQNLQDHGQVWAWYVELSERTTIYVC